MIGRHHHPRADETANFKVLSDADQLVNAEGSASKPSRGAGASDTSGYMTSEGVKLAGNPAGLERKTPAEEEARHG